MRKLFHMWASLFTRPSLEEVQEHEAEKAMVELQQCDSVIRSHRYQRHMAEARLDAIQKWRAMEKANDHP